ncbi:accessory gene regulator B family protein [Vallitalea pronyensis]|uniref:Accessory gene regulator B family protein n=1 Tax=Vallitalea pronyensis TaxID=1348613 RepID=A0A8J8MPQ0_9FIRM|nr:accessory gene regulator B family protein [Vallitalea pronyensis]QUI25113.1 accessory gene regulator B family protein [Vallitalea pronyensis]
MLVDQLINRPIYYFTYILFKKNLMSHKDIRIVKYGMQVVFSETLKILMLVLCFGVVGKLPEFFLSLTILILIRSYSGGIHFSTFMRCFSFTLVFFLLSVTVLPVVDYINNPSIYVAIVPLSTLIIYLYSPMPSKHRPISNKRIYYKNKAIATLLTVAIYSAILLLPLDSHLKTIGIWTIVLQAIQIMIAGGVKNEKKAIRNG